MAAMIDIDDFLPEVLTYAPNTSDLIAQRFIREAARELCSACKLWRATDTITVTEPEYQALTTITDAEIEAIEAASLEGRELVPKTVAWLDDNRPGWDRNTQTGGASFITQMSWNTVSVVPRQTGELVARFILIPSRKAQELPEFLLRKYAAEIGRGAAGKVLTLPTDTAVPQLGLSHTAWFENRVNTIRIKASKGQQGAPLRTKGRYL